MATLNLNNSPIGNALTEFLLCDDLLPGDEPSYQMCKTIYLYHPIGQKMAESPVKMAQFLPREISITEGPEDDLKKAFIDQWDNDGVEHVIRNGGTQARIYGIASLAVLTEGVKPSEPLDVANLADTEIAFNVLDPLNTSGSLVLNQDPNAFDYQKHKDISVQGVRYHRSRTVTLMNEQPIYIAYTSSAFGFVGRSVYQRALFPLKSFINTMLADDMVARKVGLIVVTLKVIGSIVDAVMTAAAYIKRNWIKIGGTDNVVSISEGETVTSLDLTNLEGPLSVARKDILENIAAAADMPAKLLNHETFAEGFGEGTEDAKAVAAYIDGIRAWLRPAYTLMDMVTQRRAWNPRFYKSIQDKYPEQYAKVDYQSAFYSWQNSFKWQWPSLLREPESEQIRVADTKLKAVIAAAQVLLPEMDPENRAIILEWLQDQFNNTPELFGSHLQLDMEAYRNYKPPNELEEPKPAQPFSARDSTVSAYLGQKTDDPDIKRRIVHIENYLRGIKK